MRLEIDAIPVQALADRALFRDDTRAIIVADLHLGKPAAFRAGGVPVPEGVTASDLDRLATIIAGTSARRLIILGDFLHAPQGRTHEPMQAAASWRASNPALDITLVRGNHDRGAGDPPRGWEIECLDGPVELDGMMLAHEPCHVPERVVLCGHVHPAVQLASGGKYPGGSPRAPCLWITRDWAVMPAFGGFTGARTIRPEPHDRVIAFTPGGPLEIPIRVLA